MCIAPRSLDIAETPVGFWLTGKRHRTIEVPCRECWQCKSNRINDYVGKILCEAATSLQACAITLTYAPEKWGGPRLDGADVEITKVHFQRFVKQLRNAGHKLKYFCAAEKGKNCTRRVHFHAILFFSHVEPKKYGGPLYRSDHPYDDEFVKSSPFGLHVPSAERVHIREWPYGHVFVDWTVTAKTARYCAKYVIKDEKQRDSWITFSKKPVLGSEYMAQRAIRMIELGTFPRSFVYAPPGGDPRQSYMMRGALRRDFIRRFKINRAHRGILDKWVYQSAMRFEALAEKAQRHKAAEAAEKSDARTPEEVALAIREEQEERASARDARRRLYWYKRRLEMYRIIHYQRYHYPGTDTAIQLTVRDGRKRWTYGGIDYGPEEIFCPVPVEWINGTVFDFARYEAGLPRRVDRTSARADAESRVARRRAVGARPG